MSFVWNTDEFIKTWKKIYLYTCLLEKSDRKIAFTSLVWDDVIQNGIGLPRKIHIFSEISVEVVEGIQMIFNIGNKILFALPLRTQDRF